MKGETQRSFRTFLVEFAVYVALVILYFSFVLKFLGSWLVKIYETNRPLYAALALGLIVVQGVVLEAVTSALLAFIRPRRETE
jgi:hypothetical protein